MQLTVIGTGSKGNAYLLESSAGEALLIEAGVHLDKIKQALNFNLNKLVGCIVTHEHRDHARSAVDLMRLGVDVYSSRGTLKALRANEHHRAKGFNDEGTKLGEFMVLPFDVKHDAADPLGFLIYHRECGKVLFLTDTYLCGYSFSGLNNIIIEANYSKEIMEQRDWPEDREFLKDRIAQSHMSLETCCKTLSDNDITQVNNIVLIHLSDANSHAENFKKVVASSTGKTVHVADDGLKIPFTKTPF